MSLDENNNIYGFATGRYSLTDYYYGYSNEPIKLEYEFNAVVKDNMLYIKYVGDERNSIWDGFDEEVYNNKYEQYSNTRYLMISLEDLGGFLLTEFLPEAEGYLPEGFTAEMLLAMVQEYAEAYLTDENIALVKAWYEESLAPYIQNIIDKNKTDFFKFVRLFANDLFEVETTKEGLVLKFSPDALLRLNEEAFTLSLREFIELRIGEGKINEIETALISAFVTGKTVGDALDILAERGIDIDAFIDVLDALAGKFGTSLDEIAQMVMAMVMSEEGNGNPDPDQAMSMEEAEQGQEFGIKAMLAYYKQTELRDIVMMILSEQEMEEQEKQAMMSMVQSILYPEIDAEAEDYEEQMTDYVASLKMMLDLELNTYLDEMTIYDLVASMFYVKPVIMKDTGNAEVLDSQQDPVSNFDTFKAMMKTEIDGILTEVKQFSDIRLFFDKNGGFQKLVVRVGGEEIAEDFNLEFTLQLFEGEVTKFDYDALIEEVNGVCNPLIITEENSGEWFENSTEYTLEYDEENNPTEIYFERETPSDELTSDKYRFYDYYGEINLDYESEWGYVERYITHQSITYQLGTTFMYATKGCDGYYFVTYVCPVVREYTVIVVDNAIFYSGKEGVTLDDAIVATVNVTRNEIGNITYIFKDGKLFNIDINLYEDDLEKLHNYTIESEEKTEGCAHADHEHYVCSDCGREKDVTFIKIHNTDKLVYGGDEYDMYLYVCDCGDSVYFNYNYWSDTIKQNGYYSELKHCWVEEYTSLDLKIVKEEGNNDIYKVYKYINGKETFIATYVDLY